MKLFIDFDNTIVDTTSAVCLSYNLKHLTNIKPCDIENYNMAPQLNLNEREKVDLFADLLLYDCLEFYDGVEECLKELKNDFELYLITNCSLNSVAPKSEWIKENLPDIFTGIIYLIAGQGYDKSLIDMKDSILIDDHRENHISSNAKYHFNFKRYEKQSWGPLPSESIEFTKWDQNIVNTIKQIKNK